MTKKLDQIGPTNQPNWKPNISFYNGNSATLFNFKWVLIRERVKPERKAICGFEYYNAKKKLSFIVWSICCVVGDPNKWSDTERERERKGGFCFKIWNLSPKLKKKGKKKREIQRVGRGFNFIHHSHCPRGSSSFNQSSPTCMYSQNRNT